VATHIISQYSICSSGKEHYTEQQKKIQIPKCYNFSIPSYHQKLKPCFVFHASLCNYRTVWQTV